MNKAGFWARNKGIDDTWFTSQARDAATKETNAMNKALSSNSTKYKPIRIQYYNKFTGEEMGRAWLSPGDNIEDDVGWVEGTSVETRPFKKESGGTKKAMTFDQFNNNVDAEMKNRFPMGMQQAGQQFVSTWKNSGQYLSTPEGASQFGPLKKDGSPQFPNGMPYEAAQGYSDSLVKQIHNNYWSAQEEIKTLSKEDIRDYLVKRAEGNLEKHIVDQIKEALAGSKREWYEAAQNLAELDFEADLQSITGGVQAPYLPSDSLKIMMRR